MDSKSKVLLSVASLLTLASLRTSDSKRLEYGCRVIYTGFRFSFVLGSEDGHIRTFWLLL